jgi:hypothetical protein
MAGDTGHDAAVCCYTATCVSVVFLPWYCRSRLWLGRSVPPRWPADAQTCTRCRAVCIYSSGIPGTPRVGASGNPSRSEGCSCWPWPYWSLPPPAPPQSIGVMGNSEGWGAREGTYCSLGLRKTEWRQLTTRCCRIWESYGLNVVYLRLFYVEWRDKLFLINSARKTREKYSRTVTVDTSSSIDVTMFFSAYTKIYIYIYSCVSIYIQTRILYLVDKVN